MSEVFYLFLLLILVYITTAVYLLLYKKKANALPNRFTGFHTIYNIKGLNGVFSAIHSCNFKPRVLAKEKKGIFT
jgi:hypothetical protein